MRKLNFTSLSLSRGWLIPIEKYSSVLLQGVRGTSSVVRGNPFKHHSETQCFSLPAAVALQENGLHDTTLPFSCAQKQNRET